ncbi:bile acid:sodium symporter family protein [Cellulomonas fimi]|nr:bile acid:sodium symporter family protein [Cellulomonas fimi]
MPRPDSRPSGAARGGLAALRAWVDPLVVMIIAVLVLGLLVPAQGTFADVLGVVRTCAIVLLFFLYGARMPTREVVDGLRNWRLQGSMLGATYVLLPALGLAVQALPDTVLAPELRQGVLYLSLLPSTVQSSVVFTSVARGNVAAAITGATISNVSGIVLTPVLVGLLLTATSGDLGGSPVGILLQLLLPFVVGQVVQPWIGGWVRAHAPLTRTTDRATILLVAYTSVSQASVSGAWDHVTPSALAVLVVVSVVVLAAVLAATWWGGRAIGLDRADRAALLMVGSTKSLATGLPMAAVLFSPVVAAGVALPVIVYHQLQLATCAVVARRVARVE